MTTKYRRRRILPAPPSRYEEFVNGTLSVEDLDDEEVLRMQLRASDGSFRGGPPKSLPREFALVMQREQQKRFDAWIKEAVPAAQRAVLELVNSKRLQPGDATRLKAAQEIIERFAGKTPDKVEVKAEVTKFEQVAAEIIMDFDDDEEQALEIEP